LPYATLYHRVVTKGMAMEEAVVKQQEEEAISG